MSQINIYVRKTNCHASAGGVAGRVNYISSKEKQKEKLIMTVGERDPEYWQRLAADCQYTFNKAEDREAIEARELTVSLPNIIGELSEDEQKEKLLSLKEFIDFRTGTDCLIALHDSHATTNDPQSNFHVHIIIPERSLLDTPETIVAERNLFFDENGKRRYKKSEIYENGELREGCSIVKKGTVLHEKYFGDKNSELGSQAWLFEIKGDLSSWINEELQPDRKRVVYDRDTSLTIPTIHVGKGRPDSQRRNIEEDNNIIRRYNKLVLDGKITEKEAEYNKTLIMISPQRGMECAKILKAHDRRKNVVYPEYKEIIPNKDPNKEYLRQLYRDAAVAWQNYRDEDNPEWKEELLRFARARSAEVERMKKLLGYWTRKDYEKEIRQHKTEFEYWNNRIISTSNRLGSLRSREEYLIYLIREENNRFFPDKERLNRLRTELRDVRVAISRQEEKEREERMERYEAKRALKRAKKALREKEKAEERRRIAEYRKQREEEKQRAKGEKKTSLDSLVSNARQQAGGKIAEKTLPDKNKGRV